MEWLSRQPGRTRRARDLLAVLAAAGALVAAAQEETPLPDFAALPPLRGTAEGALVEPGDTLLDIAHRYRLGFEAVQRLNPELDPWIPEPGSVAQLPTRFVPPPAEPEGIVINVPEMRLYAFAADGSFEAYAIAIGDEADPTLLGEYRVGQKRIHPAWNVPESIREEKPELPAVVPPGPDNPLGSRWMTIGRTSYGIHGTNVRWSIGRMATHGCIRLYEPEMQRLFDATPSGTRIQILYQPFKWGREGNGIFLEAHPDRYDLVADASASALERADALGLRPFLDLERMRRALAQSRGTPVRVGTIPAWGLPSFLPAAPRSDGRREGERAAPPTSKPTS